LTGSTCGQLCDDFGVFFATAIGIGGQEGLAKALAIWGRLRGDGVSSPTLGVAGGAPEKQNRFLGSGVFGRL
jgi:hypothetical protein